VEIGFRVFSRSANGDRLERETALFHLPGVDAAKSGTQQMETPMSATNPTSNDVQRSVMETMQTYWALFLVQGVVMMILGVLAVIWPQISTVAADIYIGWIFLFSGIAGLVTMFWAANIPAFLWSLLTAALSLIVGVLLLWHPVEGVVSLTLALIALFIVEGIFQIAAAIRYRDAFPDSWGWMVMSGIADLILAWLIISGLPGTASWALGLIVGVNLITSGLALIMAAIAGRNFVSTAGATR
jgi:uncharacterized membrane protein HdeD (DUF308 family)